MTAAGDPRPRSLGGGEAARCRARVRAGDAGRRGCRPGGGRDRLPQTGQVVLRRRAAVHGFTGKITNCQIGVILVYVLRRGHALIDRALCLLRAWADDPARRAATHVPEEVASATKPQIARAMVERAIAAGMPFAWVAADTVYGVGGIEMALRRAGKGYVLGVKGSDEFSSWIGKPEVAGTAETSRRTCPPPRGSTSRPVRARRGRACTTGLASNSPTSRLMTASAATRASGPVGC